MTVKTAILGATSTCRRSTERRIDENSVVYNNKIFYFMFINYMEFSLIICSDERQNFEACFS